MPQRRRRPGEYPRLTAMAFGYLATFIAALYTIKPSRFRFTAAVVVTGVAFANHPVTGGLGALQVLGVLLFVSYKPVRGAARHAGRERHAAAVLRRAGALLADAGLLGGLLVLTWWIGVRSTDFTGSPKGWDAVDHAATVQTPLGATACLLVSIVAEPTALVIYLSYLVLPSLL
jgi:hypothetical protein